MTRRQSEYQPTQAFVQYTYFSYCTDCNVDRNMKRALADVDFEAIQYLIVRLSFRDRCFVCGLTHEESVERNGQALHVDHMIPHSQGGVLSLDNSVLLCRTCNLSKMTRSLEDFLRSLGESDERIAAKQKELATRHEFAREELVRVWQRIYRGSLGEFAESARSQILP